MRAVLQRVQKAHVSVRGEVVREIGPGILVLLGVALGDTAGSAHTLASKIVGLRIFENAEGKFDHSVADVEGEVLIVSQFTLLADTRKGRRPSFTAAARPEQAAELYQHFVKRVQEAGLKAETGRFGEHMQVHLVNDGPVTIILDTDET